MPNYPVVRTCPVSMTTSTCCHSSGSAELGRQATLQDILACQPDITCWRQVPVPHWLGDDWAEAGLVPGIRELANQLLNRSDITEGRLIIVDQDHTERLMRRRLFAPAFLLSPSLPVASESPTR